MTLLGVGVIIDLAGRGPGGGDDGSGCSRVDGGEREEACGFARNVAVRAYGGDRWL